MSSLSSVSGSPSHNPPSHSTMPPAGNSRIEVGQTNDESRDTAENLSMASYGMKRTGSPEVWDSDASHKRFKLSADEFTVGCEQSKSMLAAAEFKFLALNIELDSEKEHSKGERAAKTLAQLAAIVEKLTPEESALLDIDTVADVIQTLRNTPPSPESKRLLAALGGYIKKFDLKPTNAAHALKFISGLAKHPISPETELLFGILTEQVDRGIIKLEYQHIKDFLDDLKYHPKSLDRRTLLFAIVQKIKDGSIPLTQEDIIKLAEDLASWRYPQMREIKSLTHFLLGKIADAICTELESSAQENSALVSIDTIADVIQALRNTPPSRESKRLLAALGGYIKKFDLKPTNAAHALKFISGLAKHPISPETELLFGILTEQINNPSIEPEYQYVEACLNDEQPQSSERRMLMAAVVRRIEQRSIPLTQHHLIELADLLRFWPYPQMPEIKSLSSFLLKEITNSVRESKYQRLSDIRDALYYFPPTEMGALIAEVIKKIVSSEMELEQEEVAGFLQILHRYSNLPETEEFLSFLAEKVREHEIELDFQAVWTLLCHLPKFDRCASMKYLLLEAIERIKTGSVVLGPEGMLDIPIAYILKGAYECHMRGMVDIEAVADAITEQLKRHASGLNLELAYDMLFVLRSYPESAQKSALIKIIREFSGLGVSLTTPADSKSLPAARSADNYLSTTKYINSSKEKPCMTFVRDGGVQEEGECQKEFGLLFGVNIGVALHQSRGLIQDTAEGIKSERIKLNPQAVSYILFILRPFSGCPQAESLIEVIREKISEGGIKLELSYLRDTLRAAEYHDKSPEAQKLVTLLLEQLHEALVNLDSKDVMAALLCLKKYSHFPEAKACVASIASMIEQNKEYLTNGKLMKIASLLQFYPESAGVFIAAMAKQVEEYSIVPSSITTVTMLDHLKCYNELPEMESLNRAIAKQMEECFIVLEEASRLSEIASVLQFYPKSAGVFIAAMAKQVEEYRPVLGPETKEEILEALEDYAALAEMQRLRVALELCR